MKKFRLVWWLACVLLLFPAARGGAARAADERGTILIVSSYNPDTYRMSGFISDFEQAIVQSGIPYDIYVENLECRGVAEAPVWLEQMDNTLRRYEAKNLRAVILLGQEAWATFASLEHVPPQTQIFGCFASSNGVLLPPPGDARNWMPVSTDLMLHVDSLTRGMAGGLLNKYDIGRNLDLITSLYPQVERIAFVSDNTYGGISLQALVCRVMAERYPRLTLELIDSRMGEPGVAAAYAALPPQTAVLLGTWRVGREGQYLMQRSLNEVVKSNPALPVFSVTGSGIGDVAIGGYVPRYDAGAKDIARQIVDSYQRGNCDLTHFHLTAGEYLFDARKLKEFKIPIYALPRGSVVEDTLAAKLSKYSHYISLLSMALVLVLILLTFVAWLFIRTRRLMHTLAVREGQLVEARERAEESDRLKSAFLANMSHEIRTPLNAIVGFSSLMGSDELTPEERAEYSAIVINNSDMLLTLLNDILDISSLECGKTRFTYSLEDVVQICQHVMLTTAHTRQSGVEGIFVPPCDSYKIVTDAHRLSQILINLLTNAGKFTEQGSITVAFEVREQERLVYFSVADTGPGIPLDRQEAVFNRFEKLAGNQKKGTGLGLAICRQTVAMFGGSIWVDPEYTAGARFVFTHPIDLPLTPSDDGQNPEGGGNLGSMESKSLQI